MHILHLSTLDNSGGASRAAYRLHKGLIQKSVASNMFVRTKYSDDETVISYKYPVSFEKFLYRSRKNLISSDFAKYSQFPPDKSGTLQRRPKRSESRIQSSIARCRYLSFTLDIWFR